MVAWDRIEPPTRGFSDLKDSFFEFRIFHFLSFHSAFSTIYFIAFLLSSSLFGTLGTHLAQKKRYSKTNRFITELVKIKTLCYNFIYSFTQ